MISKVTADLLDKLIGHVQDSTLSKLEITLTDGSYFANYEISKDPQEVIAIEPSAKAINVLKEFKNAFVENRVNKFMFTFDMNGTFVSSSYLPVSLHTGDSKQMGVVEYGNSMIEFIKQMGLDTKLVDLFHKETSGKKTTTKQATVLSAMLAVMESFE